MSNITSGKYNLELVRNEDFNLKITLFPMSITDINNPAKTTQKLDLTGFDLKLAVKKSKTDEINLITISTELTNSNDAIKILEPAENGELMINISYQTLSLLPTSIRKGVYDLLLYRKNQYGDLQIVKKVLEGEIVFTNGVTKL